MGDLDMNEDDVVYLLFWTAFTVIAWILVPVLVEMMDRMP
jgi:hypothetical protein